MASDQVVIALGVLAVAGPIVTTVVTLWFQGKREKEMRAAEVEREHLRHTFDLRRNRQAKLLEFRLADYRERMKACESLAAAVRQFSIWAGTRLRYYDGNYKPITAPPDEAATAEDETYNSAFDLFERYPGEALSVLETDPDVQNVLNAFDSLPRADLKAAPTHPSVRKAWIESEMKLKQAVFDYCRILGARLLGDDPAASVSERGDTVPTVHGAPKGG